MNSLGLSLTYDVQVGFSWNWFIHPVRAGGPGESRSPLDVWLFCAGEGVLPINLLYGGSSWRIQSVGKTRQCLASGLHYHLSNMTRFSSPRRKGLGRRMGNVSPILFSSWGVEWKLSPPWKHEERMHSIPYHKSPLYLLNESLSCSEPQFSHP